MTYQAACAYALTSATHPEDQKEAVALLRRAVKDGFHDAAKFDRDPDLAAIRGSIEFARILDSMKNLWQ